MVQEWNSQTQKFENVEWPNEDRVVPFKPATNLNYPNEGVVYYPGPLVGNAKTIIPNDSAFDQSPESNPLLARLEQLQKQCLEIARKKNADYAGDSDPFANFKAAPMLAGVSVEQGMLVRMADKFVRVKNLIGKDAMVADESLSDSLLDLGNYCLIMAAFLEMKGDVG